MERQAVQAGFFQAMMPFEGLEAVGKLADAQVGDQGAGRHPKPFVPRFVSLLENQVVVSLN